MKVEFKNMNALLDRWLQLEIFKAPDRGYAEDDLKSFILMLYHTATNSEDELIHYRDFIRLYQFYLKGDFQVMNELFADNGWILRLLSDGEVIEGLESGGIISKKLKLISRGVYEDERGCRFFTLTRPSEYKIIDQNIRIQLFKAVKNLIFLLEIKRKLFKERITPEDFLLLYKNSIDTTGYESQANKKDIQRGQTIIQPNAKQITSKAQKRTDAKEVLTQEDCDLILDKIKSSDNKFWKGVPMEKVVGHFEILTTTNSEKNGRPFLTVEQFIFFIKRAFLNEKKIPKQKINVGIREKGFIIKRFYEFYSTCMTEGDLNKKDKYIQLLSNNFVNWEYQDIEDLFKPNKIKRNWE